MALIIELFGIPGAGKSAYRTQLTEELRAGGIEVADPGPMARTKGRYTQQLRGVTTTLSRVGLGVRNRRVLWWCLSVLRRSPRPFSQKIAAFRFVFVTLERYAEYHGDVSDRVYIMDEGSLQRLFLLLVERDGVQAEVDRRVYMDAAPFGDVLVHVQISPEEALARLAKRDRRLPPRLLGLAEPQARLCLAQGDALLAKAATEAVSLRAPDRPARQLTQFRSPGVARAGGTSDTAPPPES